MVDGARWLAQQGLGHHAEAFAENGIAGDVLPDLTDADLKELGLNLGDRKRLRVAGRRHLADCVIATGIRGGGAGDDARIIRQIAHISPATSGIRRTGSASTDLAWLAAGRFDGYWDAELKPWDVAPGWLVLREAGGTMTDHAGAAGFIEMGKDHILLQRLRSSASLPVGSTQ